MKKGLVYIIALVMALLCACQKEEVNLNGTVVSSEVNLYGKVISSIDGKGIAGVPVTDGYSYCVTDENGVYQLTADSRCRTVYLSLPSGYAVPRSSSLTGKPIFWQDLNPRSGRTRADFVLEPEDEKDDFTLVMISDPQVKNDKQFGMWEELIASDIQENVSDFGECYGFVLGDIVYSASNMYPSMQESLCSFGDDSWTMPMFGCAGNHDHAAPAEDDYGATATYTSYWGPTDYSLNRGKTHIVVMDNVMVTSYYTSSLPNGYAWSYEGGFTDEQLEWLKQDLATVENPSETLLIFCTHVPFRWGAYIGSASVLLNAHYSDVLSLMTDFKEAHIMTGHTHSSQNYIHEKYICAGGEPIYEHIHGSADGCHWKSKTSCCFNGTPSGYGVYSIKGAEMADYHYRSAGEDDSYQIRVYNSNQTWKGSKGFSFSWTKGGVATFEESTVEAKGLDLLTDCFIAEIWGSDSRYWSVELWQNGVKAGDFELLPEGYICNIPFASYYLNSVESDVRSVSTTGNDFWVFKAPSGEPSAETDWEVRAVQTLPSGTVNTYTRNSFTTNYNEFK